IPGGLVPGELRLKLSDSKIGKGLVSAAQLPSYSFCPVGPLRPRVAPPDRSRLDDRLARSTQDPRGLSRLLRFFRATVVLLQHFKNFERKPHCRADCLVCYLAHSGMGGLP